MKDNNIKYGELRIFKKISKKCKGFGCHYELICKDECKDKGTCYQCFYREECKKYKVLKITDRIILHIMHLITLLIVSIPFNSVLAWATYNKEEIITNVVNKGYCKYEIVEMALAIIMFIIMIGGFNAMDIATYYLFPEFDWNRNREKKKKVLGYTYLVDYKGYDIYKYKDKYKKCYKIKKSNNYEIRLDFESIKKCKQYINLYMFD